MHSAGDMMIVQGPKIQLRSCEILLVVGQMPCASQLWTLQGSATMDIPNAPGAQQGLVLKQWRYQWVVGFEATIWYQVGELAVDSCW